MQNDKAERTDTFVGLFQNSAFRNPNKIAIVEGENSRTYAALYENACKINGFLRRDGIHSGETIGVVSLNTVDYVETIIGIMMAGGIPVKINWRLETMEIDLLLQRNKIRRVFYRAVSEEKNRQIVEAAKEKYILYQMDSIQEELSQMPVCEEITDRGEDSVLFHLHTSGTSGTPKIVRYLQKNYMAEIRDCLPDLLFTENTVFQTMSQMFHSACLGAYCCLVEGGTLILFRQFSPEAYLASIEKHKVNRLSAIPTVLMGILSSESIEKYDVSSVDLITYSTCPMPPDLIKAAMDIFHCGFLQAYGMTEMGSIVTILGPKDHYEEDMRHLNSVGRPARGHQVRIMREDGTDCEVGESGEIVVKGSGMMLDYYDNPEEYERSVIDGWYHTGDVGYLDEEGFLFLNGRKNDLIISGGENIYPREVETVIRAIPGVREVYVLGVPDRYWIEAVHACVILKEGYHLTENDIRSACRGKIGGYKIPKRVHIVKNLPRTATGKIEGPVLRKMILENEI